MYLIAGFVANTYGPNPFQGDQAGYEAEASRNPTKKADADLKKDARPPHRYTPIKVDRIGVPGRVCCTRTVQTSSGIVKGK